MTNAVFRAYRYAPDHPAFSNKDLTPKSTITEMYSTSTVEIESKKRLQESRDTIETIIFSDSYKMEKDEINSIASIKYDRIISFGLGFILAFLILIVKISYIKKKHAPDHN